MKLPSMELELSSMLHLSSPDLRASAGLGDLSGSDSKFRDTTLILSTSLHQ